MLSSLRGRVTVAFLLLIIVCLVLLSTDLLFFVRDQYQTSLRSDLRALATLAASQLESSASADGPPSDVNSAVARLAQQTGRGIVVVDQRGQVVARSGLQPDARTDLGAQPEIAQALTSAEDERAVVGTGEGWMRAAAPLRTQGQTVGALEIVAPLDPPAALRNAILVILVGLLLSGLLAVAVAALVVGPTSRAIKEMTRYARTLAQGDLDQTVTVSSPDEVGALGTALAEMAARLKETIVLMAEEGNKTAAVLTNMADGVVITDGEGRVTLLNKAAERLFQLSESRALGRSFIEVVRDHELAQLFRSASQAGDPWAPSTGLVEVGTPKRSLRATVTPISYGKSARTLVVLQDLTELRRMEAVRREFIGNVSHELRTPLASIKALVETLEEGALDDPAVARRFLSKVNVEVDGMSQLIRELLELSRIESGQTALRLEPTEVGPMLALACERLQAQAARSSLQLRVDLPEPVPAVLADEERVLQVLLNLLHNAIKFTPPGGRITLSATRLEGEVAISVSDTGVGIASEDLPRIFERFYKADKSRASGGTGLGLAIAKHLIQAHGGRIWAESEEGRGATFILTLPVAH
ncbi:MAG: HAMP domain-containing protein [Chloroflexota bacterium]|nr:MAG: HAMP domain-containing protein [Chloroflexota bacterium]